ncbi:unnamed protein product [Spirodela intermedia]|uniref:Kinesin-like protein n=1 Tax=Spirodela intermedia TaxID=51605 RepID=A0A7I8JID1_SPIIN|nr:unnamed protein product [Spirodela intermedia]CAA6669906.1 unnamed protein product [Spirodela intermedia]
MFETLPSGRRTFDVFIQEEKVVSGIDIYAKAVTAKKIESQVSKRILSYLAKYGESPQIPEEKGSDYARLQQNYNSLKDENERIKRDLEDARKEKELTSKECHEAWMSLQELQTELMRKSMHVGSLAFAVEGQVKEKTRWCSALRELNEKFEFLKLEHAKVSSEASKYRNCLADMSSITATIQSAMNDHSSSGKELTELQKKFVKETKGRKELYNRILELKGDSVVVDFEFAKDGELVVRAPGSQRKVFKFDSVFSPQADQEMIFENTSPFATSVLDGYNVCIFAYGQTGTGKTFTMEGTKDARGVNYRILEELFRIVKERQGLLEYEISVSVLEVYNEQIRDLLLSGSQSGVAAKRLEIKQVAGVHHVPGLVEARVSNMNEVWEVLQTGTNARAVGATNCNEHSSRSHCIHCVMVKGQNLISGECTKSKLWLIDLAGSERVAKTDVQGDRLKEAQSINKSLSALGDVISALATKSPHIPFRNSKLTHLLQDSLGGDSKTLMFVQISPKENDAAETLCSLNFASRVRGIELGPAKRQLDSSEALKSKHMLEKAKQEIKGKDDQIKKMEEAANCLESRIKSKDVSIKHLQDRVKELESQLLIERKLARQHVDTRIAETHHQLQRLQQQERDLSATSNNSNRPPLTVRPPPPSDNLVNVADTAIAAALTDVPTKSPPSSPPPDDYARYFPAMLKENKPAVGARFAASPACNRRVSMVPAPRRESLIPPPAVRPMEAPLLTLLAGAGEVSPPLSGAVAGGGLRGQARSGGARRISSILRRSLQKKVVIKPPLQQFVRRGAGQSNREDKGGGGVYAAVPPWGRARRLVEWEQQQQRLRKEKERQWGISGRRRQETC